MAEASEQQRDKAPQDQRRRLSARRIDAAAWGLLFIWFGVVWLANIGLGIVLLGIAAVILGAQIAKKAFHVRPEIFWVVIALSLALAGAWRLVGIEVNVIPFLFIAVGIVLLVTMLARARRHA